MIFKRCERESDHLDLTFLFCKYPALHIHLQFLKIWFQEQVADNDFPKLVKIII